MIVNSFFCGGGGMDLGFLGEGFKVQQAWDFNKYAVASYNHNIGDHHTAEGGHRHAKIYCTTRQMARRMTPREYARCQGFPETYEQVVSNTQFYKIMGNAVAVPVARYVAFLIKHQLHNGGRVNDRTETAI